MEKKVKISKQVLSEIALYYGSIDRPKGYEVNRQQIKADILEAQLAHKTESDSPYSYRFFDYKLNYSKDMGYVHEYVSEYFNLNYGLPIVPTLSVGNVLEYREQSFSRKLVEQDHLRESADFVMIYGVDVTKNSTNIVIEYDNNRRVDKTWHAPLNNNDFVMFPSSQRFFITGNTSHSPNVFLLTTFELVG